MIKRSHAENMLDALIRRVESFENPIYEVQHVVVFGSFLQFEKEELGDLDVGIAFRRNTKKVMSFSDQGWTRIGLEVLGDATPDLSLVNLDHMEDNDIGNRINQVVYDADRI